MSLHKLLSSGDAHAWLWLLLWMEEAGVGQAEENKRPQRERQDPRIVTSS